MIDAPGTAVDGGRVAEDPVVEAQAPEPDAQAPEPQAQVAHEVGIGSESAAGPEGAPSPRVAPSAARWRWGDRDDLSTIERLREGPLTDRVAGWVVSVAITAIAFGIRIVNLGYPTGMVFDETYYAKDGYALWKFGYERNWPDDANASIVAGSPDVYKDSASFIVHPPVGKWLIGLGEQLFGMNSFGWRFMPLVFGSLLVFVTIRLARRLSRSTLIGAIAGVLITFDGLAFTMSRIALLDIFQAFFLAVAVSAIIADRDYYRHRLADHLQEQGIPDFGGRFGPVVWLRPWRLVAGVAFGLALGTKWNSVYLLAAMGVLSVLWDVGARRLAGADWHGWLALLVDGIPAFVRLVVVSALVYVGTWAGWLTTSGGYNRDWGSRNPDHPWVKFLGDPWASLLWYHKEIYEFHVGDYINNATHPYDAHPAGWLVMARPIGIDAVNDIKPGTDGCLGPDNCIRVISGMGTPMLWWMAALALVVAAVWWIGGRDWRFGVPLIATAALYLPWFNYTDRPLFFFYAITFLPYTVTALALVLGLILGPARGPNRRPGAIIVGIAVCLVVANFAWIYPVLTDQLLPYQQWLARMWLRSWI